MYVYVHIKKKNRIKSPTPTTLLKKQLTYNKERRNKGRNTCVKCVHEMKYFDKKQKKRMTLNTDKYKLMEEKKMSL
jgi:hypothetical protein